MYRNEHYHSIDIFSKTITKDIEMVDIDEYLNRLDGNLLQWDLGSVFFKKEPISTEYHAHRSESSQIEYKYALGSSDFKELLSKKTDTSSICLSTQ